jgi:hypothetical protein
MKHRRTLVAAAMAFGLVAVASPALAGNATPSAGPPAHQLTLAVFGDEPYGTTPVDTDQLAATPAFIASINHDRKADLVLHIGDIHSGKQYCTQGYDQTISDLWKTFKDPLVYTPGDNEWSDCHKPAEGGGTYNATTQQIDYVRDTNGFPVDYASGDPLANLDLVRSTFFAHPGFTLGGTKKRVTSQAEVQDPAHPADAKYVENVMWEQSKVLFVTINLPGGSNNDTDVWYGAPTLTPAQAQEVDERTGADLRWITPCSSALRPTCGTPRREPRTRRPTSRSCRASPRTPPPSASRS